MKRRNIKSERVEYFRVSVREMREDYLGLSSVDGECIQNPSLLSYFHVDMVK